MYKDILDNLSISTLLSNILFSFAQFKRDMIVKHTQEDEAIEREAISPWKNGKKEILL